MVGNKDDKNDALVILVDDILSKLNIKIKRLKKFDKAKHNYEIQFLEYLQNNFIRVGDFRNQICDLIPYYQNEIASKWEDITDKKFELEKRKQEVDVAGKSVCPTIGSYRWTNRRINCRKYHNVYVN